MIGDILFYTGSGLGDEIVKLWTKGPYVHCAIDYHDGVLAIAATATGVLFCPRGIPTATWAIAGSGADVDSGYTWLTEQLGSRYNWQDIVMDAIPTLRQYGLNIAKCYDCSELATRFLIHCGYNHPAFAPLIDNPGGVSPNDLARALRMLTN